MRQVLILGAGGHGSVCYELCRAMNLPVLGFLDDSSDRVGQTVLGRSILGKISDISRWKPDEVALVNGIGSVGVATVRDEIFQRMKAQGYAFQTLVHPSATVSPSAVLEEGGQVHLGACVQTRSKIGVNAIVNTGAIVDHDCVIGVSAHIAPGAVLSGGGMVGDLSLIGTGARMIQRVKVGDRAVIGAGAVVVRDVPSGRMSVGVPAQLR